MTENGAVTTTRLDDPEDKATSTDGCPLPRMEVRVVDPNGAVVPAGEMGQLQARGCSNFVGYLKRPELDNTNAEGWFDTGDLARMEEGYIRIAGRSKDIIIRGGENIPVVEVEGLLFQHPSIAEVAVVGFPDARLGERACAFVKLRDGATLSFREMSDYLNTEGMARPYIPERLENATHPKRQGAEVSLARDSATAWRLGAAGMRRRIGLRAGQWCSIHAAPLSRRIGSGAPALDRTGDRTSAGCEEASAGPATRKRCKKATPQLVAAQRLLNRIIAQQLLY
jgi:acyl-CoA synthetase (AMP-forming)/AMP-acid ligase II